MISREDIFNIIPTPKNEDVIIYDTTLKDLLGIDVLSEYEIVCKKIDVEKENYKRLETEIDHYKEVINNSYLYTPNWNEVDYIDVLQKEKKNYSILFGEMKKMQSQLNILQRRCNSINEQIEMQKKKDLKEIEEKKNNIDIDIASKEKDVAKIEKQIEYLSGEASRIIDFIGFVQDQIKTLEGIKGKDVSRAIDKCNTKLKKLDVALTKNNVSIQIQKEKLKQIDVQLKNLMQFKQQDFTFYVKKSIRVLELEAQRDQVTNEIIELKQKIENDPITKDKSYQEIVGNIEKFETSLENLKKIKEYKANFSEKLEAFKKVKEILTVHLSQRKEYVRFLDIYYKIYEQKANDYFGPDIKFKFHEIIDDQISLTTKITYKGQDLSLLNYQQREELEERLKTFL